MPSRAPSPMPYAGWPSEINGGLNNMIMVIAQLLHDTCPHGRRAKETLVLPRLTTGVNFFTRKYSNDSMEFGEVFSVPFFQHRVQPCVVVAHPPPGAVIRQLKIVRIDKNWPYDFMLPTVYNALRPGRSVRPAFTQALDEVYRRAGRRWAAVHLRIERDWFFITDFCNVKRYSPRRCFTPTEVAAVTRRTRARANASGTLLLYAEDLMSPRGPKVDIDAFGAGTIKLPRLLNVSYTARAAIEMFVAAEARAGFYGNSYSTFSRGVAMLRSSAGCASHAAAAVHTRSRLLSQSAARSEVPPHGHPHGQLHGHQCHSFAYDCANAYEKRNYSRLRTIEAHGPHGCSPHLANGSRIGPLGLLRVSGKLGSLEPARAPATSLTGYIKSIAKGTGAPLERVLGLAAGRRHSLRQGSKEGGV